MFRNLKFKIWGLFGICHLYFEIYTLISLQTQHIIRKLVQLFIRQRHLRHDRTWGQGFRVLEVPVEPVTVPLVSNMGEFRADRSALAVNAVAGCAAVLPGNHS